MFWDGQRENSSDEVFTYFVCKKSLTGLIRFGTTASLFCQAKFVPLPNSKFVGCLKF